LCFFRQFDGLFERFVDGLPKQVFVNEASEIVSPKKFAVRGDVFGKGAVFSCQPGKTSVGVVFEVGDGFRDFLEVDPFAISVKGVCPLMELHHPPKGDFIEPGEVFENGEQHTLLSLFKQGHPQVMVVNDEMLFFGADDGWEPVLLNQGLSFFARQSSPLLSLVEDLLIANAALRGPKRGEIGFDDVVVYWSHRGRGSCEWDSMFEREESKRNDRTKKQSATP
jgi:hypothetical protein